jgi:hypothetical protein
VDNHQKNTGKIEKERKIEYSSWVPQSKSLKIFHKNIRGLGNKANEVILPFTS